MLADWIQNFGIDPWWPWIDVDNFRRRNICSPTKFHFHKIICMDLIPVTLNWPAQFSASEWIWELTPDDLELTFTIFGIGISFHQPSFTSIGQYVRIWSLWPRWPWIDPHNFRHRNISPPTKFHFHRTIRTELTLWPPMTLNWPLQFSASEYLSTNQVSLP